MDIAFLLDKISQILSKFDFKYAFQSQYGAVFESQNDALVLDKSVLAEGKKADKVKTPVNKVSFLDDIAEVKKSIRKNPFEKFERKRFFI